MTDTTASVVAEVKALGTDYRLVRQLAGGLQSSAYELSDGGPRVVLKWSDDPGWAPRVRRRATVAVCAAAAYASVAEFVRQRSRYSQDLVLHGGRRLLELLVGRVVS